LRIQVRGEGSAARVLAGYLAKAGYRVNGFRPAYTVTLEEGNSAANIVIEGHGGELAAEAQKAIAELTATPIEMRRAGESDRAVRVVTTGREEDSDAIERGLMRAVLRVTGHGKKSKWRIFGR
jgi:hypothetical protein